MTREELRLLAEAGRLIAGVPVNTMADTLKTNAVETGNAIVTLLRGYGVLAPDVRPRGVDAQAWNRAVVAVHDIPGCSECRDPVPVEGRHYCIDENSDERVLFCPEHYPSEPGWGLANGYHEVPEGWGDPEPMDPNEEE